MCPLHWMPRHCTWLNILDVSVRILLDEINIRVKQFAFPKWVSLVQSVGSPEENKKGWVEQHSPFLPVVFKLGYWSSVSVQSLSCGQLFVTPRTTARQASLSIINSWSLPKLKSIESVMPSNHLILCRPLLLLPSIFHQGLFKWVSFSHQVAKVLEFQLQHQSFQWTPRTHLL